MGRYDLFVKQGESLQQTLIFRDSCGSPIDLSGREGHCQVRETPDGELLAEADVLIIAGEGRVTLSIPAAVTQTIEPGCYAWDFCLETLESGEVRFYLEGAFHVLPAITKVG